MITHNLFLSLPNVAIFLDIPLSKLRHIVPRQYKTLTLQQVDAVGRHLQGSPSSEEQKIICLISPPGGWRQAFMHAAKPSAIPEHLLERIDYYMTEAPFLSSIIEILHWINQMGFYKQESIHKMAHNLSVMGYLRLFSVIKGEKIYRKYYSRLLNPPILEVMPPC